MAPGEKKLEISESTFNELFGLIRGLTDKIAGVDNKVAALLAVGPEKEKRCTDHIEKTEDHEKRLRSVELWKAGQQGVAGFLQRWGPVVITGGVAIYVGKH